MTTTFAVSGQVLQKCGAEVSNYIAADTGEIIEEFINQAEDLICSTAKYDLITNWDNLTTNGRKLLTQITTDLAATECIAYDMSYYYSRTAAENLINIRHESALRGLSLIRNKPVQDYLNAV